MEMNDFGEMVADKIMYRIGEMTVMLGLFLTAMGAVMMMYNDVTHVKKDMEMV